MIQYFSPLMKDGYKVFHKFAYNPLVTHVYSNFTNRFGKHSNIPNNSEVMFVGLQYFVKEVLIDSWNDTFFKVDKDKAVAEYKRVVDAYLGKPIDVAHYEALHDLGYLPVRIKAVPEGTLVPYGVPSLSIVNTVEGFGWITNALETVMSSEVWPICTSATTAFAYRKRFEQEPNLDKDMIPFMGHDFSYRGMMGTHAAAMSGFGHLTSFAGSDTIPAGLFAEKYYNAKIDQELVLASVDATEHSVMCSYGNEGELESLEHLITKVTPEGIISIVSDTWDFWKLVTEYLPQLKNKIMERDGTVVIRPDSGDPVEILCGKDSSYRTAYFEKDCDTLEDWKVSVAEEMDEIFCEHLEAEDPHYEETHIWKSKFGIYEVTYAPELNRHDKTYYYVDNWKDTIEYCTFNKVEQTSEDKGLIECLWEIFGGTEDENGMKLLDSHIGAIYGDSITLERQDQIIKRLVDKGFVPNVVLGIGSYTYQYVTRDTHGSAVKATDTQHGEGSHHPIFKDPKTDTSKRSAKGLLRVDEVDGKLVLRSDVTPEEEKGGVLEVVFEDGKLIKETSLQDIRERVNLYLN